MDGRSRSLGEILRPSSLRFYNRQISNCLVYTHWVPGDPTPDLPNVKSRLVHTIHFGFRYFFLARDNARVRGKKTLT
jgi:hypothetical protein